MTWLLRFWDVVARDMRLDGSEAKQLGSLSWDGGIDKGIGKSTETLSLWRQLLSSVRERYSLKDDLACSLIGPLCCGMAEGQRTTGTNGYYSSAALAISRQPGLHDPHPGDDLRAGETGTGQQDLLTL